MSAVQLVKILNSMFTKFDRLAQANGVDKIKTIGDCYVAASNVLTSNSDHAKSMIKMVRTYARKRSVVGRGWVLLDGWLACIVIVCVG